MTFPAITFPIVSGRTPSEEKNDMPTKHYDVTISYADGRTVTKTMTAAQAREAEELPFREPEKVNVVSVEPAR